MKYNTLCYIFLLMTLSFAGLKAQNIGIGTPVPLSKLSVSGNAAIGAGYMAQTAPVNGLIVQGNVGIGISTPSQKLEVVGNIKSSSFAGVGTRMVVADATGLMNTQAIPTGTVMGVTASNGLTSSGGTAPNIALGGTLTSTTTIANAGFNFTISGAGNVGIGTSTPTKKLEVSADALINGVTIGRGGGNISTNTALGYQALYSNSNTILYANYNMASGYQALYSNTTGYNNVASGASALYSNTTGSGNVASGYQTLYSNTTGYSNVASGASALYSNTNGNYNIAIGVYTLHDNTTGSSNVASGASALTYNTTGSYNIATGFNALLSNTIGDYNIASGYQTLFSNISGDYNIASGYKSLYSNTVGGYNIACNYQALYSNTTGSFNIASGYKSLYSNTVGGYNIASGYQALYSNITGGSNIASGYQALYSNTIGDYNVAIGNLADVTANNLTNAIAIGYNAKVNASNKVILGNTAVTSIGGQVGWTTFSDKRLKKNIIESNLGLNFILKLRPVTYEYIAEGQQDIRYTGLIAQEVDEVAKGEFSGVDKNGEYWGIRYAELTVPLIKALQEMQKENETLKFENEKHKNDIEVLKLQVAKLNKNIFETSNR